MLTIRIVVVVIVFVIIFIFIFVSGFCYDFVGYLVTLFVLRKEWRFLYYE